MEQINTTMLTNQQQPIVVEGNTNSISVTNLTTSVPQDATNSIGNVETHNLSTETSSFNEFFRKLAQTYSDWERYEQPLSEHAKKTQNVLNNDCLLIAAERDELSIKIRTMPNEWIKYRENKSFNKKIGLEQYSASISTHDTVSKLNKAQQIILKSTIKKFDEAVEKLLALPKCITYKNPLVSDDFIEIKVIEILIFIKSVIEARNVDYTDKDICDIWFGLGKFINQLESLQLFDGITNELTTISELVINDLKNKYNQFVERFQTRLSYLSVCTNFAELFLKTSFDKILPGCSIKPYKSQKEFLKFVHDNINRPYVCVYNTIMGSGKTSVVAGFAKLLHRMEKGKTLLYVCPEALSAVREMVGSLLYNFQMNFAIASVEDSQKPDGTFKVSINEQNLCKNSEDKPTIILTGVVTLIELLKQTIEVKKTIKKGRRDVKVSYKLDPSDYVIFFDENTVTLDNPSSPMVKYLSEFYHLMPSQVIFSSATHLPIEELNKLRHYVASKRPETIFKTIDYSEVKIGTQLYGMDGQLVIPHSQCTIVEELKDCIEFIKNNLMYKKFYTFALVISMYNRLVELGFGSEIPSEYHFNIYMDDFSHRNQESIQNLGIFYLELVVRFSGEEYDMFRHQTQVGFNNLIELFNTHHNQVVQFNYDDLIGCIRNDVLRGQTFVSCSNPYQEMMFKFGSYLEMVKENIGYVSFKKLVSDYNAKKERAAKEVESRRKSTGQGEKVSKLERDRADATITDSISDIVIPSRFGLNGVTLGLNNITYEDIPDSDEYDNLLLAAMIGIVVYRKNSNVVYHDMVKKFISNTSCSIVFADSSLNYGNSFPFNNGIILNEMAHHSANTLLQLIGRAGRVGLSSYAKIYAGNDVCQKLFQPIYNPNYLDWEKINMNKCVGLATLMDIEKMDIDIESFLKFKENLSDKTDVIQEYFLNYITNLEKKFKSNIKKVLSRMSEQQRVILDNEFRQIFTNHTILFRPEHIQRRSEELSSTNDFINSNEIKEIIAHTKLYRKTISTAELMIIKVLTDKVNLAKEPLKNMLQEFVSELKKLSNDGEMDAKYSIFDENRSSLLNQTFLPLQQQVQEFVQIYSEEVEEVIEVSETHNTFILLSNDIQEYVTKFDRVKNIAMQELNTAKSNLETLRKQREEEQVQRQREEEKLQREREKAALEKEHKTVQSVHYSQRTDRYVPSRGEQQRRYNNNNSNNSDNWRANIQITPNRTDTTRNSSSAGSWRSNSKQTL